MKWNVLLVMPNDEQVNYETDDLETARVVFNEQLDIHANELEYIQIERIED